MRHTIFTSPICEPPLRISSRILLKLFGWKLVGECPPHDKFVMIASPHTSNWDFLWLIMGALALEIRVFWMGKHTLFRPPFRWLIMWLGGVPIDRRASNDIVEQMRQTYEREDVLQILIPAEGSRSKRAKWKTGFWYIAKAAGVPLYLSFLCYGSREVGMGPRIDLTDDLNADMRKIKSFYIQKAGKYPENGPHPADLNEVYEQRPISKTGTE